ncbi:MAG: isoprenylcysteine carboxylmethyltransferase family protein [Gammaproteobacteria bacterium]|nr:MAG: isoprenylcysteine carboxylmethyltransferase family protein [Gammaproteobacteria bacterium]
MAPVLNTDHIVLALLAIVWCAMHSWLISISVTQYLKQHLGSHYRFYRLFFNGFALISFAAVIVYRYAIRGDIIFDWQGWLRLFQIIMIILGVVLFFAGAQKYDARRFLGLAQLKENQSRQGLTESGALDTSGILRVVRHPWYAALLLLIWAMPLDIAGLVLNLVFTGYLLMGARLEERKLVHEFGDAYRHYQQQVSMLLPLKWIKSKLVK